MVLSLYARRHIITLATISRHPIRIPNIRKVEQSEIRLAVSSDILSVNPS